MSHSFQSRTEASALATPVREQWSGQLGFILSAIGSAVGLGNIWRFPGVAYENGGGAFLVPYLIALLTAGVPILLLDYTIGHRFRGSPPLALRRIGKKLGESLGWFQVFICVVITIYYTAVIAWSSSYFVFSLDKKWGNEPVNFFMNDYLQVADAPFTLEFVPSVLIPLVIIWLVSLAVVGAGVIKGVQRANMIAIPLLIVAFLTLVIRALFLPGAIDGLNEFFTPNFATLADPSVWIAAYGQIFFSLSIAYGVMITYASYRKRRANLSTPGLVVAFGNSSFELLAGVGVFATLGYMAFQQGGTVADLEGITGISLSFITFPAIISAMPGGALFGSLFFGSLVLAGLTSLISILEVTVAAVHDKFGLTRHKAVWGIGGSIAAISILLLGTTSGLTALDVLDHWSNNLGIVLSAAILCILSIWVFKKGRDFIDHVNAVSTFKIGKVWFFCVGFLAPIALSYMLIAEVLKLIFEPYGGYSELYLIIVGWGSLIAMIGFGFVFASIKWRKKDPEAFDVYPNFDVSAQGSTPGIPPSQSNVSSLKEGVK